MAGVPPRFTATRDCERCGSFHVLRLGMLAGDQAQVRVPRVLGCNRATLQLDLVPAGTACGPLLTAASGLSGVAVLP